MPSSWDLLNPGYTPPDGAQLNEWGYYVMPNGNLADGQTTPGNAATPFTPVDATGNYNQGGIPSQYTDPSWSQDATGAAAWTNVPGSPNMPGGGATDTGGGGGGGFGGGGGTMGGLLSPWGGSFTGGNRQLPATPNYTAPTFNAPTYNKPDAFKGPTFEEAMNEPGYKFSVGEGERAMEQSAAARGTLNTGGTLKDLLRYGQAAGAQNYQNVYSRNLGTYNTNVQTQNIQPYQFAYAAAMDQFAPKMAEFNANVGAGNLGYSTTAAWNQRANEQDYNQYLQQYNEFDNQRKFQLGAYQNYYGM